MIFKVPPSHLLLINLFLRMIELLTSKKIALPPVKLIESSSSDVDVAIFPSNMYPVIFT